VRVAEPVDVVVLVYGAALFVALPLGHWVWRRVRAAVRRWRVRREVAVVSRACVAQHLRALDTRGVDGPCWSWPVGGRRG